MNLIKGIIVGVKYIYVKHTWQDLDISNES